MNLISIKKTASKSLIVMMTASTLLIAQTGAAYAATSNVSPSSTTIGVGQTTSVNIIATNGSDSNAADVFVTYDSNIITPVSIVPGPGVSQLGGGSTSPNFELTVFEGGGDFTDGEILAVITFTGKAVGSTTLNTTGTDIQSGGNVSPGSGLVTVTSGTLPDAGLLDSPGQVLIVAVGSGVLVFGLYLAFKTRKEATQE